MRNLFLAFGMLLAAAAFLVFAHSSSAGKGATQGQLDAAFSQGLCVLSGLCFVACALVYAAEIRSEPAS